MDFLQNNYHQAVNKIKWIEKILSKTFWIFKEYFCFVCVSACGCVRVFEWFMVAYYCVCVYVYVWVAKTYVYVKVHA